MVRQQRTPGAILEIELGNGHFSYAQILKTGLVFFDFYSTERVFDLNMLNKRRPLFFLSVYRDVITQGRWKKIGKLPIKEEYGLVPMEFIQDIHDPSKFRLYNPNTGKMLPATRAQCEGLECAAVWEAEHVESRIIDHYNGAPNIWVDLLKIK
jgi:hypothetical protein